MLIMQYFAYMCIYITMTFAFSWDILFLAPFVLSFVLILIQDFVVPISIILIAIAFVSVPTDRCITSSVRPVRAILIRIGSHWVRLRPITVSSRIDIVVVPSILQEPRVAHAVLVLLILFIIISPISPLGELIGKLVRIIVHVVEPVLELSMAITVEQFFIRDAFSIVNSGSSGW